MKKYVCTVAILALVAVLSTVHVLASPKNPGHVEQIQPFGNYCYPKLSVPPVATYDSDGTAHIQDNSAKLAELQQQQGELNTAMQKVIDQEHLIAGDSHANNASPEQQTLNGYVSQYNNLLAKYDTCVNR